MKNILFTLLFVSLSFGLFAQIGITGAYSSIKTAGWEDVLNNEGSMTYNSAGYTVGLEYWFRLPDFRVEFLPEISYGTFDNKFIGRTLEANTMESELSIIAFAFNTQIYIFDMEGDCNCPTWGKDGSFFNKGFYLMAGPGISYIQHTSNIAFDGTANEVEENNLRLLLSAGVGFDIGITKALTVTVFGRYKWHQSKAFEGLERLVELSPQEIIYENYDSVITQFEPGLKLSYRWGE